MINIFCWHKWKIIDKAEITYMSNAIRIIYTLRCDKCGYIKSKSIWVQ